MSIEKVFEGGNQICAPVFDGHDLIISSLGSGEIIHINLSDSPVTTSRVGGAPSSVQFDKSGIMHIADLATNAILKYDENGIAPLLSEYEDKGLKGPNSIVFDSEGIMYFTDSGPIGETTLFSPKGSLFMYDNGRLQPLILEGLAHPSGLAIVTTPSSTASESTSSAQMIASDKKVLYVCETMTNRLLRGVENPKGCWHFSVFYQFSGMLGPSCIAVHPDTGNLYVGMFDFATQNNGTTTEVSSAISDGAEEEGGKEGEKGFVQVITPQGEIAETLLVPGSQITGLCFSSDHHLYITESYANTVYSIAC